MALSSFDWILAAGLGVGAYLWLTGQFPPSFFGEENEEEEIMTDLPTSTSTSASEYSDPNLWFPIQDLYVPPNYYRRRYNYEDEYRKPSEEFEDWYKMGSGLYLEDYYIPPHYWQDPDIYYWFGNRYKRRYPSIMETWR